MPGLQNKIKNLPETPGVYFFLNSKREILYIGKAGSLKDRVKSYFSKDLFLSRSPLIEKMVAESSGVKFQKTESVLEALILEASLIKKHQPKYNTQEKDDKSWNYVVITNEDFPRILLIRGKELNLTSEILNLKSIFGPFPHGNQLKEALKIIRKIFPFLDQNIKNPHTERFYQELGLAPKTDSEEAKKEYQRIIRHIKLFFEGKKKQIIKGLLREMKKEVKKENFEKAAELRNKIFALEHIQDIALLKSNDYKLSTKNYRIESYDIAHIMGKFVVGGMVVIENGEFNKSHYRKFRINPHTFPKFVSAKLKNSDIKSRKGVRVKIEPGINDPAALKEIIKRRLNHKEWPMPDFIVVDGGLIQKKAAENAIKESNFDTPVVSVVKDEKHKPKNILGDKNIYEKYEEEILRSNIEAHRFTLKYHKTLRENFE